MLKPLAAIMRFGSPWANPASGWKALIRIRSGRSCSPLTWFCVRRDGVAKRSGWLVDVPLNDLGRHLDVRPDERIEVCILDGARSVPPKRVSRMFYPRVRGIIGMEIGWRGHKARYAPTRMISGNLSFDRVLERFLQRHGVTAKAFERDGELRALAARQYLVHGQDGAPLQLFRGSTLIDPKLSSGADRAADVADGVGRVRLGHP